MKEWFSINERKLSTLVMGFFIFSAFALWQFTVKGIIDASIQSVILTLISVIAGYNAIDIVSDAVKYKVGNKNDL